MADHALDSNAKYAKTHEWVRLEDGTAVVGISDAAQDLLSDIVYVELPETGRTVQAGEQVAVVESVKAAEDIYAPVAGTIIEVNQELESQPEQINGTPYAAWFFKIEPSDSLESDLDALMTPDAYAQFVAKESH
ncbi:MAG: glycine cleavage system protein GcvH [Litorilinea sp.]